ncbi:MAG: alpha/beta hydrolase [Chthoniobacteraceae bacterium]
MKSFHLVSLVALSLVTTAALFAEEKSGRKPMPPVGHVPDSLELKADQPYAANDNPWQAVDLYLPKHRATEKPLPVVVYIHGGGWSGGSRRGGGPALLAASGNYAGVSVGYRLSNEAKWPAQIHDCKAAIRWIRGHAKEYNLDPEHIGVTGTSAGGHLVSLLGLTEGVKELEGDLGEFTNFSSKVTCVVNVCGPQDMASPLMQGEAALKDDPAVAGLLGGSLKEKAAEAKACSPLTYVHAGAPPFMTLHGTKDMRVNFTNATRLQEALTKVGSPTILIPITDGGHGFNSPEAYKRVQQFFDMHLRGIKSEISSEPATNIVPLPAPSAPSVPSAEKK